MRGIQSEQVVGLRREVQRAGLKGTRLDLMSQFLRALKEATNRQTNTPRSNNV